MFPLSCHTQVASPPPPSPFPPFVSLHPTSPLPRFTLASHASRSPFPTPFGSCHCPFTACLTAARFETNNGASYLVLLPVGRGYERTTLQPSSTSTYPSVQILVVSLFSLPSLPLFSLQPQPAFATTPPPRTISTVLTPALSLTPFRV